jgi:hypothetical protein
LKRLLLWTVFAATATLVPAQVIVQYTAGPAVGTDYWGQSFTTPGGGPWSNITFNFYSTAASGSNPASTPTAVGSAFLLTQEYLGTPAALSASTPGFVAESVSISGGMYIFAPSVVLNSGTKYWVYENASMFITGSNTAGTSAQALYVAPNATSNFINTGTELANYTVSGTPTVPGIPVPPSILLTIVALGCLGLYQASRRFANRV